jgi:hypothetical protein
VGVFRVLLGFVVAIGITGAWMLLACAVMAVSLYVARLVPLAGKRRRRVGENERR